MGQVVKRAVLIVDDEDDFLDLAVEIFGANGYRVRTAHNAKEAESALTEPPCGLAIIDYRLPGEDGAQVAKKIQQHWPQTKIVFLTGDSEAARKIKDNEVGISACLMKPVEIEDLLQLVENLLRTG